tara:strand:+ start:230 stop:571 length:342 start_codon:yes stop_codon:yes gene_type:complete
MENFSDEKVKQIINSYQNKREREKKNYDIKKDTDDFKQLNRARSKRWYDDNNDKRKQKYQDNKHFMNAKSSYLYYKKLGREDEFKIKCSSKYHILVERHYLSESLPIESVSTS